MRSLVLVILFLSSVKGICQDTVNYIDVRAGYGFLIAHRANMRHLQTGPAKMVEIGYKRAVWGAEDHLCKIYPGTRMGMNLSYMDVGNQEVVGWAIGAYPSVSFLLGKDYKKPRLRIGAGLGYVQKPFDQDNNVTNIAIGSYLNALVNFSIEGNWYINENHLKYGFSFTHYSNAAFSAPNLGLNIPTLYLGYSFISNYRSGPDVEDDVESITLMTEWEWRRNHELLGTVGWRENSLHNPKKYAAGSLGYQYLHQFSHKLAWSAGADFFFNPSLQTESDASNHDLNWMQAGAYAGLEVLFNNHSMYVQQGVYLFSPYKGNGWKYNRLGYRYRFENGIIAGISLKSHLAVAEYFHFDLGYVIGKKTETHIK